jgi:hypothetical protein
LLAASWRRGVTHDEKRVSLVVGACVLALVGTAGAVAYRDLTDRYLFMGIDERLRVAEQALATNRCDVAVEAADRALRLGRRDPVAVDVATRIRLRCGAR